MWPSAWYKLGPVGEPTPRVLDTVLVGGKRHGERLDTPEHIGRRLRVPHPMRLDMYRALSAPDELPAWHDNIDDYERRWFRPSWAAAPVGLWVLVGLSDDDATAILREQQALPSGVDVDAEFARVQHETAMRRLREIRDQFEDEGW